MSVTSRLAVQSSNISIMSDQSLESAIEALRSTLAGELIMSDSPLYDTYRKVQDITVDRRPLVLARIATAADVAATVGLAREFDLPIVVRSGGHSLAGLSMADDAVVVDLSAMKGVTIDPVTQRARVQSGATTADVIGPAAAYGLALTTGDTASVGIGGLTTGGGIGFMVRKYGLTIDNLLSAEVVTADGEVVTASPTEHPDLFWAIRGGGGNFGIVTEFEFQLAPVSMILGGVLILPATREVVRGYLEVAAAAPDELSTIGNIMPAPPAPFIPADRVGEVVLFILAVWSGDPAAGERALAPLRALAQPVADTITVMPYAAIYNYTAAQAAPHAAALRSMFANALSDATLDASIAAVQQSDAPVTLVHLRALGGAMARVDPLATAFAHRHQPYMLTIIRGWADPTDDGVAHRAWVEDLWQQVRSEADGVYVNFLTNEGADRVKDAYPPATYARLAAVKQAYDPFNRFRYNQNVRPG